MSESLDTAGGQSSFRLSRVLWVVVPALLLAGGAVVFFGFLDGMALIQRLTRPPLVPVTGTVFFNGQPLANARVMTKPTKEGLRGSVGFTDEQGNFYLEFDNAGTWIKGAYAGEHKVTVAAYGEQPPAGPPPLLTPEVYERFETTPLVINVTRDPSANHVRLELKGEPAGSRPLSGAPGDGGRGGGPGRGGRRGGGFGGPGGPPSFGPPAGGAPGRGRGPVSPEMMVARGMETFDKDGDGKLNADELREAIGIFGASLENADKNSDRYVDAQEMLEAFGGAADRATPPEGGRPQRPEQEKQDSQPMSPAPQQQSPSTMP
ncbi:MAG: hypothetical protein KatS3mg110_4663 [Pirellulaceae bacterium]|nr:MAG: hypothetical protein KatS3mg110_4663 [Pirellulaceae bacterium]